MKGVPAIDATKAEGYLDSPILAADDPVRSGEGGDDE